MFKPQLEDVSSLCQEALKECRIEESSEDYQESLDFFKKNGFFFEECFDLDYTLAALILPRLIYFRDNTISFPGVLAKMDDKGNILEEEETNKQWHEILDKMIYAFWIILKSYNYFSEEERIHYEEYKAAKEEGLALFAKYFESLWE